MQKSSKTTVQRLCCTSDGALLYETVKALLADEPRRAQMRKNLRALAVVDSTDRIYKIITELAKAR